MDAQTLGLRPFAEGIGFGEGPRWHDEALWLSDIVGRQILRVTTEGRLQKVLDTPGEPSGLGWLPDGGLLVVQMDEHEVWLHAQGKFRRYSGTAPMSRAKLNDMVVDRNGRAWVSNLGFDYEHEAPRPTNLICVDPGGHAWIAAEELWCPNGMAIDDTGELLFVGQSASREVLEFAIGPKGVLKHRRVFGTLPEGAVCDGLCVDRAQALWIASPVTHEFLRMERGGRITHRVPTGERHAIACVLGGPGRRTLYCVTSATMSLRAARGTRDGRVEQVEAPVAGAGIP
jgi:sugar lactone lactonase YvrE